MDKKEYRTRITDLYVSSLVELLILADQAMPTKSEDIHELKNRIESTVANMLAGYMEEYIDSVVSELNDPSGGNVAVVEIITEDDDERILH